MRYLIIVILFLFAIQISVNAAPTIDEIIEVSVGNNSPLVKGIEWVTVYIMSFLGLLMIVKLITDFLRSLNK